MDMSYVGDPAVVIIYRSFRGRDWNANAKAEGTASMLAFYVILLEQKDLQHLNSSPLSKKTNKRNKKETETRSWDPGTQVPGEPEAPPCWSF